MPFEFAHENAVDDAPPIPTLLALRDALQAVKLRICFIGHPREPRRADGSVNWEPEIALIERALALCKGSGDGKG